MAVGDTVIIYERHDSLSYIQLQLSKIHDNKFGTFHHNDFIGKPFGSKVYSRGRSGWIYALEPSPELWSHAMHTRTQIVDESDASYVTFMLDVYPGCKVARLD
jgi:tRNA (adenine57-N1/adenine58-N1)-methyltransferase catalytic subunit